MIPPAVFLERGRVALNPGLSLDRAARATSG